jgi:hypothetical protein
LLLHKALYDGFLAWVYFLLIMSKSKNTLAAEGTAIQHLDSEIQKVRGIAPAVKIRIGQRIYEISCVIQYPQKNALADACLCSRSGKPMVFLSLKKEGFGHNGYGYTPTRGSIEGLEACRNSDPRFAQWGNWVYAQLRERHRKRGMLGAGISGWGGDSLSPNIETNPQGYHTYPPSDFVRRVVYGHGDAFGENFVHAIIVGRRPRLVPSGDKGVYSIESESVHVYPEDITEPEDQLVLSAHAWAGKTDEQKKQAFRVSAAEGFYGWLGLFPKRLFIPNSKGSIRSNKAKWSRYVEWESLELEKHFPVDRIPRRFSPNNLSR